MSYQLRAIDKEKIRDFMEKYDFAYAEVSKLENEIQSMLKRQGMFSEMLTSLREKENQFFEKLAEETGESIIDLKRAATSYASDVTSQKTIS
jgi:hypothetical protein